MTVKRTAKAILGHQLGNGAQVVASCAGGTAATRQETERIGNDVWGLEGNFVHAAIVALEQARARLNVLSPSEALDVALHMAGFSQPCPLGRYNNAGITTPCQS